MDQLFAPWRIQWVTRESQEAGSECPFCTLPTREDHREALVVAENERAYVLLNNYPYNPGHALVVPHRHVERYRDLDGPELRAIGRLSQRTIDAQEAAMGPDGYNIGVNLGHGAGGSIDHMHVHVVPRWQEDTNFMAVIDETKVIVQALEETYELMRAAFEEQDGARDSEPHHAIAFTDTG